jgi:glycerol-3-phosphate acyltransferase PlsY
MEVFINIALIISAYLCGSVPFGLLLTKYAGLGDIREIGSGNIGATNVMRTGNKKLAIATLILDGLKGSVVVVIAKYYAPNWIVLLCGVAAILGHIFPVWLKFKGGKGVATTIAVYWVWLLPLGIFVSIAWLILFHMTRMSSMASILSISLANVVAAIYGDGLTFLASMFITVLVIYRHKENIKRILRGEEKPFSTKVENPSN